MGSRWSVGKTWATFLPNNEHSTQRAMLREWAGLTGGRQAVGAHVLPWEYHGSQLAPCPSKGHLNSTAMYSQNVVQESQDSEAFSQHVGIFWHVPGSLAGNCRSQSCSESILRVLSGDSCHRVGTDVCLCLPACQVPHLFQLNSLFPFLGKVCWYLCVGTDRHRAGR